MQRDMDLPDVIPLFPLSGALLLPRGNLPLQIYEPRYLMMVEDALRTPHRLIGMIQPHQGGLRPVGCAGRITAFNELDDGRYMISLKGIARFDLGQEVDGFTPYRRAHPDWSRFVGDRGAPPRDPRLDRDRLFDLVERAMTQMGIKGDLSPLRAAEDEALIHTLAMLAPFSPGDKQALLEAKDLPARREVLMTLLEFALRGSGTTEDRLQ